MKYKLHTTSVNAWDGMLSAIEQAKKSIYIEMYIFMDDTTQSHDFIGKLIKKATDGIKIIIVADAYGSKVLKKETIKNMQRSGIEFLLFSHWLRHIHRKILIVDEKIAFIGGVNIGKQFTYWNDLQLQLEGRIAKTIMKSFSYTYEMAGGKDKKILGQKKRKLTSKLKFLMMEHWPIKNIYSLKSHYIEKITQAEKSIQIVTPYFTPPRWLISLLDTAIRKNIQVEILIPQKSDLPLMDRVNYHYINKLHQLGIKFFLAKEMNHAKLLIIDGEEGLIGSQNIDPISFTINAEAGIFFKEKKLLRELSAVTHQWKRNSTRFEPNHYKMKSIDYAISFLTKILRPML